VLDSGDGVEALSLMLADLEEAVKQDSLVLANEDIGSLGCSGAERNRELVIEEGLDSLIEIVKGEVIVHEDEAELLACQEAVDSGRAFADHARGAVHALPKF
jgi:hypothetical protein